MPLATQLRMYVTLEQKELMVWYIEKQCILDLCILDLTVTEMLHLTVPWSKSTAVNLEPVITKQTQLSNSTRVPVATPLAPTPRAVMVKLDKICVSRALLTQQHCVCMSNKHRVTMSHTCSRCTKEAGCHEER